jgi:hypothetical protein
MTSQSYTIFGSGIVAQILAFVVVGLALVFGTCSMCVNGLTPPPTEYRLQEMPAPESENSKQRAQCADAPNPWRYVDCLKEHGLRP